MAMADLARSGRGDADSTRAVSLAEISARQDISLSYLEQLFARLRRAGLVDSVRGPGGGYRLSRPARDTAVADIVLAVDEPLRATRCSARALAKGCMPGGERCLTHDLWADLGHEIQSFLAAVSLEDVILGRTGQHRRQASDRVGAAA